MKKSIFVLLFFLSVSLTGQNYFSLVVMIVDSETGIPIENATLSIKEAGWLTKSSGSDGKIFFDQSIPEGEVNFIAVKEGYVLTEGKITISRVSGDNSQIIRLVKHSTNNSSDNENATPKINVEGKDNSQVITSINQSGGITTGTVNINPPQKKRVFTDQTKKQLNDIFGSLRRDTKIEISHIMGNQEAKEFAEDIRKYLNSQGFLISSIGVFMSSPPVVGNRIHKKDENHYEIQIGYIE